MERVTSEITTCSPHEGLFAEIRGLVNEDTSAATRDWSASTIKTGDLKKTTQSRKSNLMVGPTRERRFKLTKVAMEYLERFSQVKVRRSFPLTSIESVEEPFKENPRIFKLVFTNTVMVLEAPSSEEAADWVQKIREVWAQWHTIATSTDSRLCNSMEEEPSEELNEPASGVASGGAGEPQEEGFPSTVADMKKDKNHWRRGLIRRKAQQQHPPCLQRLLSYNHLACEKLHEEYAMIKYPHKKWSIPSEKLLHVDRDNLHIMWRRSGVSAYRLTNTLPLRRVWEIREGQWTKWFHHFPYEEVEGQSFSLIFEEEKDGGRYVGLTSLDLICDHPAHYKEWIDGLKELISGPCQSMWNTSYPSTDPSILWLKRLWTTKHTDHELLERVAAALVVAIHPSCDVRLTRELIRTAHNHQSSSTNNYGHTLLWDGYTLLFNLMCENGRLLQLFKTYTRAYPSLGLTKEEFGDFLIEECSWRRGDCTRSNLLKIMKHHDYHHKSFKKYAAKNRPLDFNIATTKPLLSFAGFLSFLRSSDNGCAEKEELSQNMDHPLSHYFINSSHNTYLEGDQLKGKSSCEAYVRALLQGCRCVEIDCWDGALRVGGEAITIYHGYTLTTKLDFTSVVRTIRNYAFHTSLYPVIISIENHCSSSNQKLMAKHFLEIMGDVLCRENLAEAEGRERLPSPVELQGKIILKGTFKKEVKAAMPTVPNESSLLLRNKTAIILEESLQIAADENRDMVSIYGLDAPKMVQQDDQETPFVEDTAEDLENLVVYCRSINIKPWSWSRQRETSVSEMFSLGEPSSMKLCKHNPHEMITCTERQLVRTYPKGTRFDSSNYDPTLLWVCGVQMVALNFQTPDVWMHLNQGFFRQNGGCGYVLKPEVMWRSNQGSVQYSPFMTEPHPDIPTVDLEIELISGQQLCPYKKRCVSLTVDIQTFGIPADISAMPQASHDSAFWPQWERGTYVYKKKILMPELCLVYFRVEVQYTRGHPQLFGQNCIPLPSLKPGVKFIPLRTSGGDIIQESGLFVKITKESNRKDVTFTTSNTVGQHFRPHLMHQASFDENPELS